MTIYIGSHKPRFMQKNHFKGMKEVVRQVRFKKDKVQENNVIDNYGMILAGRKEIQEKKEAGQPKC